MNRQVLMIGAVVLIAVVGGYLLLGSKSQSPSAPEVMTEPQESAMPETSAASEAAMMEGVKEFTFVSEGLKFAPNEIKVKVGDKVRITYKNMKGQHNLALDEFNVKTKLLNAGEEETVEFVADKAGKYEFYCPVPGHKAGGMKGTLIVE